MQTSLIGSKKKSFFKGIASLFEEKSHFMKENHYSFEK
jgi:hypothetical protein